MSDAPFFEPLPEPEDQPMEEEQVVDLPWVPPTHIAGVVVGLGVEAFRGDDVAVLVTHAVCFRRGLEVHVRSWVRPGGRPRQPDDHRHHWGVEEPRVGIRLADGTRLGHRHPHSSVDPAVEGEAEVDHAPVSLTQTNGSSGWLEASSSWWVHPVPDGDSLEVVVMWEHVGVPESAAPLDLNRLREAAEGEDVLWDPPPPPSEGNHGWFAYAPLGGSVYRSGLRMTAEEDDEGETGPG